MSGEEELQSFLRRLAARDTLGSEEATRVFAMMMEGGMSPVRVSAILTALAVRGPSVDEIVGGARALRAHMIPIAAPANAIDLCGTGGDSHGTLNVSTAVSFVVAACGVPVAKHGNRAMSSRTGAADVLEALGVNLGVTPQGAERCLGEANMCFLFAQAHHPAMRHVGPVRRELGFRTLFNLLGPLSNPAGVRRQLLGVFDRAWLEPLARALQALGTEKAWIVHGSDGLDEITLTGPTHVVELADGKLRTFDIQPEDAGLGRAPLSALKGGSPAENAEAIRVLFSGAPSAFRDIVLLNAAAALTIAGACETLRAGADLAARALDSGAADTALQKLIAASRAEAA